MITLIAVAFVVLSVTVVAAWLILDLFRQTARPTRSTTSQVTPNTPASRVAHALSPEGWSRLDELQLARILNGTLTQPPSRSACSRQASQAPSASTPPMSRP